jgi:hypothetical protein
MLAIDKCYAPYVRVRVYVKGGSGGGTGGPTCHCRRGLNNGNVAEASFVMQETWRCKLYIIEPSGQIWEPFGEKKIYYSLRFFLLVTS